MTKLKSWLAGFVLASLLAVSAFAQTGQLGSGQVWGNSTASQGVAAPTSMSPLFDRVFGSSLGTNLVRGVSAWLGFSQQINAKALGVKEDGIAITPTVSIASGSGALTATGASFNAADVGKSIIVQGAGTAGAYLTTTIASFTDPTHVGLTATAGTTITTTAKSVTYCSDDSANLASAVTAALTASRTIVFTDGIVCHSGSLNWAWNNLHVQFQSDNVTFIHTGTGIANSFSGIANYPATQGAAGGVFGGPGRPMLRGNPAGGTTEGLHIDNWHFGYMKVAVHDATTAIKAVDTGIVGGSAVEDTFDFQVTPNTNNTAFIIQAGKALDLSKVFASTFVKPIIEGNGAGGNVAVVLTGSSRNIFQGGTIESNAAGGISEDSTSNANTFLDVDVESNGTSEWTLAGTHDILINSIGSINPSTFNTVGAQLLGGTFTAVTNNDNTLRATNTEFLTSFTNNGTATCIQNPQTTGTATCAIKSNSASALAVGLNGATNPAFRVDASTASQAAGFEVVGTAAGGTPNIRVISSNTNETGTFNGKAAGGVAIGNVSTGGVQLGQGGGGVNIMSALTYGGVTLSNAVTGTGNMVLSASPTFSGTIGGTGVVPSTALANTAVTAGSYGSSNVIATFTVNAAGQLTAANNATLRTETVTVKTTGTSLTYTSPATSLYVRAQACGGGGGGGGSGTGASPTAGSNGTATTVTDGATTWTGAGGTAGQASGAGGGGGTATNGDLNLTGSGGQNASVGLAGGVLSPPIGGHSGLFGLPGGNGGSFSGAGQAGAGGGGAGCFLKILPGLGAAYTYTVGPGGAGGAAGTSGNAGAAGANGLIVFEEH